MKSLESLDKYQNYECGMSFDFFINQFLFTAKENKMENLWMYISVIAVAVSIFAMIDIAIQQYSFKTRMLWLPIVILIPLIGPIIYYSMRKSL